MENQLIFYIAALLGVVVHFILQIRDAQTKMEVFNWQKQLINSIYIIIMTAVLVAFRLDVVKIVGSIGIDLNDLADNKMLWFFVGYFADSVWKNIERTGRTILKTEEPNKSEVQS